MTLHNRLDARLLDQMAQPHQHGEAKYRGCADPSRLRGINVNVNICQAYYCPSLQRLSERGKLTAICHGM